MKPSWFVAPLSALLLVSDVVRAGVSVPGFKSPDLQVLIDNLGDSQEHHFVQVPST